MSVLVRYFAAAKAAAGVDVERLEGPTLRAVLSAAIAAHPTTSDGEHPGDLERVLGLSSFLVDGVSRADLDAPLADGQTVDVLPPFAGG